MEFSFWSRFFQVNKIESEVLYRWVWGETSSRTKKFLTKKTKKIRQAVPCHSFLQMKYFLAGFHYLIVFHPREDEHLSAEEGIFLPALHLCVSAEESGNTTTCKVHLLRRDHSNGGWEETSQIQEQEHQWVSGVTADCVMAFWSDRVKAVWSSWKPSAAPTRRGFPRV